MDGRYAQAKSSNTNNNTNTNSSSRPIKNIVRAVSNYTLPHPRTTTKKEELEVSDFTFLDDTQVGSTTSSKVSGGHSSDGNNSSSVKFCSSCGTLFKNIQARYCSGCGRPRLAAASANYSSPSYSSYSVTGSKTQPSNTPTPTSTTTTTTTSPRSSSPSTALTASAPLSNHSHSHKTNSTYRTSFNSTPPSNSSSSYKSHSVPSSPPTTTSSASSSSLSTASISLSTPNIHFNPSAIKKDIKRSLGLNTVNKQVRAIDKSAKKEAKETARSKQNKESVWDRTHRLSTRNDSSSSSSSTSNSQNKNNNNSSDENSKSNSSSSSSAELEKPSRNDEEIQSKIQFGLKFLIENSVKTKNFRSSLAQNSKSDEQCIEKDTYLINYSSKDTIVVREYAKEVFKTIREKFANGEKDLLEEFSSIKNLNFSGKSGSFLFVSKHEKYILKTVPRSESKFLRKILPSYYEHLTEKNKNSVIIKLLGMYRFIFSSSFNDEVKILVMKNIFWNKEGNFIDEKYDLKGSTVGRKTLFSVKTSSKEIADLMLKDQDFQTRFRIKLGRAAKNEFLEILKKDCEWLENREIMDYSLLFGVHFNKKMKTNNNASNNNNNNNNNNNGIKWSEGGIESTEGDIYYCGIIDILQMYNARKIIEKNVKGLYYDKKELSVCSPKDYCLRFLQFIATYID